MIVSSESEGKKAKGWDGVLAKRKYAQYNKLCILNSKQFIANV